MSAVVQIGFDGKPVMAGLSGLESRLSGFANKTKGLLGGVGGLVGGGLATLGVGLGVEAIKETLNKFDDLADTSLRLNESVEVLQRVGFAAEILAGVDLEGLTSQFLRLEKSLGEVGNEKASEALANLGISAESLARQPLDQKILMLSSAFQKARESGTGYNDILALMGKSAGQLIPLLSTSADEIRSLMDAATVVEETGVRNMAALNDRVDSFVLNAKAGFGALLAVGASVGQMFENMSAGQGAGDAFANAFAEDGSANADRDRKRQAQADAQEAMRLAEKEGEAREKALESAAKKEAAMMQSTERLRVQYGEAQFEALQANATLEGQIANLKQLQAQKAEALRKEMEAGPLTEQRMLEFANEDLALEERRLAIQKQLNEKRDGEAKAARDEAEGRAEALASLVSEVEILQAKAGGQDELVKKLEREEAIRGRVKQLVAETGMSEQKALETARQLQDLAEKAEKREEDVGEKRIKGFSAEAMGGREEARARAAERRAAGDARRAGAYARSFEGLDGFYADQKDPGFARAKTPVLDAFFNRRGAGGEGGISMGRAAAVAAGPRGDAATGVLQELKGLMERSAKALEGLAAA